MRDLDDLVAEAGQQSRGRGHQGHDVVGDRQAHRRDGDDADAQPLRRGTLDETDPRQAAAGCAVSASA